MKDKELMRKIKGIHTIESIMTLLDIDKNKAVYYIHRLRKLGYVKTERISDNRRLYRISHYYKIKGKSYYEILNENSPVKLIIPRIHKIYGRKPTLEETLIWAVKTKNLRTILAALSLFRKIKNYSELYKFAKENNLKREIGILYDLSRRIIKTRKMPKRFKTLCLPKKGENYKFIIKDLRTKDFNDLEKIWKVYLPFNKADLEDYR